MHGCTRSDGDDLCRESICLNEDERDLNNSTPLRQQKKTGTTSSQARAAVIRPAAGLLNPFDVHSVPSVISDP